MIWAIIGLVYFIIALLVIAFFMGADDTWK